MTNTFLIDGNVKTNINNLPEEAWTYLTGQGAGDKTEQSYYQKVPWLYRGVTLRADAVSSMPFAIVNAQGDDIDTSEDYQNVVGFLPHPDALFWQIEAALTCLGKAYLFREEYLTKSELRYLLPTSIKPIYAKKKGDGFKVGQVKAFERRIGNNVQILTVDEVIYFWMLDPFVEHGPAKSWPLKAALAASGVLFNLDEFIQKFIDRGLVKATILSADGVIEPDEKIRFKTWWQSVVSGVKNAWGAQVLRGDVKATVIGEGFKELENVELTGEKREDISTGLGIPQSLLFSNAANYATAKNDRKGYYENTIIPECNFIARVFNVQAFTDGKMRLEFRPETLDVFQEEEKERADAFKIYAEDFSDPILAGQIVGIELPPGYTWEGLAAEKEQRRQEAQAQFNQGSQNNQPPPNQPPPPQQAQEDQQKAARLDDLRKWAKKSRNRGHIAPFESDYIPDSLLKAIQAIGDVDQAFSFLKATTSEAEDRIQAKVLEVFKQWKKKFVAIISDNGLPPYEELKAALQAALGPEIAAIATEQALSTAAEIGVEFDVAMVNDVAAEWARSYTFELVTGLTDTTRNVVSRAVEDYTTTPGMTRGQLEELLEPAFGQIRAEMIAVTETTRAYSQSMNQYQRMIKEEADVDMERIWHTNRDGIVCEAICEPLNEQPESVWVDQFPDGPPAHVRCRCFTTLRYRE